MKINKPYALNEMGQRQNQEDSIFPAKNQSGTDTHFFLVCDGMGGHENGEVASQTVCESFGAFLKTISPEDFNRAVFEQALSFAYDELDKKDTLSSGKSKMGTTLTFLHLSENEAFLAHIGDSRIYQLRTENGEAKIIHKTSDHSYVNELLLAGVITEEEAKTHPKKNVITRAMQPHLENRFDADIDTITNVKAGDCFFLCSDGVLESLSDEELMQIVSENPSDEAKIQAIANLCSTNSRDNFSAYLVPVIEGIAESAHSDTDEPILLAELAITADETSSEKFVATDPPLKNNANKIPTVSPVKKGKNGKAKFVPILFVVILLLAVGTMVTNYFLTNKNSKGEQTAKPSSGNREKLNSGNTGTPSTPKPASPAPPPSSMLKISDSNHNKYNPVHRVPDGDDNGKNSQK